MKALLSYLRTHLREIRIIIYFVFSTLVIIYLFPREGRFRYEFQKGNPWMHDEYIAPFDFPIYKFEEEVAVQRDSILTEFKPYFVFDRQIVTDQLNRFAEAFTDRWDAWLEESGITGERRIKRMDAVKENYSAFSGNIMEFVYN